MTPNQYQEEVKRTQPKDYSSLEERIGNSIAFTDLIHAQIGITTEAGEFADTVKKSAIYNQNFDEENAREELGDLLWYIALACNAIGCSMETVMQDNIDKLKMRYPEKFTEELAKERLDKRQTCRACGSSEHKVENCPNC